MHRIARVCGHAKYGADYLSSIICDNGNGNAVVGITESKKRLDGMAVVITGAASGIGRASSLLFAREGARLVCADWNESGVHQTVEMVRAAGGDAIAIKADAASDADNNAIVQLCVSRYGRLDVFFANAGIMGSTLYGSVLDVKEDALDAFRVNSVGAMLAIKYAARQFIEQDAKQPLDQSLKGGSIIVTASVAGLRSGAGRKSFIDSLSILYPSIRLLLCCYLTEFAQ
jgi:NAD(P)-dependent dehydrogenase (short-subunit alcohol dehydrogenase family)